MNNGNKNGDLQSSYAFNSVWADRIARLIILGLAVDIVVVFISGKLWLEAVLTVIADTLIIAGVWGELWFARRAKEAGDGIVAKANERAAKADLARVELEKQLAPRVLTKEQFEILQTLRGKVSTVCITAMSDFEALRFSSQIADALRAAGIEVQDCNQRIGLVWTDLIAVFPKSVEDFRREPLYTAFHAAGLSIGCNDRTKIPLGDLPSDVPIIMVGEKKPLYPTFVSPEELQIKKPEPKTM